MQTRWFRLVVLALVLAVVPLPVLAQDGGTLEANLTDSCAESYNPDLNYFPDQASFEYAEGVTVEYFNNYKLVTVTQPWDGATEADAFQYVLVQCGTPAPEDAPADALVLEVPINTVMAMSTTQLPHFSALGVVDRLIGVDQATYVSDPDVIARYEAGEIIEIGYGSTVNVELVLDAEPDLVMTYGLGSPESDAHPVLLEAGVPFAMNAEHAENSPLGRVEWLKFTALFFNQEAAANDLFATIAADYEALVALTADIPADERPLVLPNTFSPWTEAWSIPGALSYAGQLYADAGAALVLGDDPAVAEADYSVLYDFETVYVAGLDAAVWITNIFGVSTLDDLLALDARYGDFTAAGAGMAYNNSARVNVNGGNDFYESGVLRADLVLADLVSILYPDLLPDHELVYYLPLVAAE